MCLEGFRGYEDSALPVSFYPWGFFLSGVWGRGSGIYFPLVMFSLPHELENRTVAGAFPEQSRVLKETPN